MVKQTLASYIKYRKAVNSKEIRNEKLNRLTKGLPTTVLRRNQNKFNKQIEEKINLGNEFYDKIIEILDAGEIENLCKSCSINQGGANLAFNFLNKICCFFQNNNRIAPFNSLPPSTLGSIPGSPPNSPPGSEPPSLSSSRAASFTGQQLIRHNNLARSLSSYSTGTTSSSIKSIESELINIPDNELTKQRVLKIDEAYIKQEIENSLQNIKKNSMLVAKKIANIIKNPHYPLFELFKKELEIDYECSKAALKKLEEIAKQEEFLIIEPLQNVTTGSANQDSIIINNANAKTRDLFTILQQEQILNLKQFSMLCAASKDFYNSYKDDTYFIRNQVIEMMVKSLTKLYNYTKFMYSVKSSAMIRISKDKYFVFIFYRYLYKEPKFGIYTETDEKQLDKFKKFLLIDINDDYEWDLQRIDNFDIKKAPYFISDDYANKGHFIAAFETRLRDYLSKLTFVLDEFEIVRCSVNMVVESTSNYEGEPEATTWSPGLKMNHIIARYNGAKVNQVKIKITEVPKLCYINSIPSLLLPPPDKYGDTKFPYGISRNAFVKFYGKPKIINLNGVSEGKKEEKIPKKIQKAMVDDEERNDEESDESDDEYEGGKPRKMLCKNCKKGTRKYYKGTEKSPLGKGYSAYAECPGKIKKGIDGKKYVVVVRKNGAKAWKRV